MGLFNIFYNKEVELTQEERKWNKMWELWENEEADSPYAELMTYQGEVNNGGHDQYFFNINNYGDLIKEMATLETILPKNHKLNLKKAYKAYLLLQDNEDDEIAEETLEQCDDMFYGNEEDINRILESYAATIEI